MEAQANQTRTCTFATVDAVLFLNHTTQPSTVGIDDVRFKRRAPPPTLIIGGASGSQPPVIGRLPAGQASVTPNAFALLTMLPETEVTGLSPWTSS